MPPRRRPRRPEALLLWPGAGTGAEHRSLVELEVGLPELAVRRIDFPYRRAGRKAPDRAPKLIDAIDEDLRAASEELGVPIDRIVIGGRSMGGRMCSMAAAGVPGRAEGPNAASGVAGVFMLAYPLHPPGRPEKRRTEHLGDLAVPSLWLCGDRDPFGTPEELAAALTLPVGPVTSVTLPGGHDLGGAGDRILAELRDWLGLRRRPAAR